MYTQYIFEQLFEYSGGRGGDGGGGRGARGEFEELLEDVFHLCLDVPAVAVLERFVLSHKVCQF